MNTTTICLYCTRPAETLGMCPEHLWRWAFRCEHSECEHDHARTVSAASAWVEIL